MYNDTSGDFELYLMGDGFVRVSSGIQRRILKALQEKDLTATEIAQTVGRSRSTVSVHLENLEANGLIEYRWSDTDARSKVFTLISDPLIKAKRPDRSALTLSKDIVAQSLDYPESTSNIILRAMILIGDGAGLDLAPILFTIGCDFAENHFSRITTRSLSKLLDAVKMTFDRFGLGELSVYSKDPITILFRDTIDLTQTSAEVMASFVSGFLVTIFRHNLGEDYRITDQEVFGDHNNYIRMRFEPVGQSTE